MNSFISLFWDICRFRAGPQDVPCSKSVLWMVVVAYMVISTCIAGFELSPPAAVTYALIDVGIVAGLTRLVLWIRELDARMIQTTAALLGSGALIGFIAVPVLWWIVSYDDPSQAILPSMVWWGMVFWNVAVVAHILRHAMNVPFVVGVGMSLIYMYVSMSILGSLFFVPAGQQ